MQRSPRRLAWRSLNIGPKVAILFAALLVLIFVLVIIIRAAYNAVRVELETGGEATVEMRELAQDVRLTVQSIQDFETRVVEQRFGWDTFSFSEARLRVDHSLLTQQLADDLARLHTLAGQTSDPVDMESMTGEIRQIETYAASSEASFGRVLDTIGQLAGSRNAAISRLEDQGDEIEALTREIDSSELIEQILLMRDLERSVIETGDPATLSALREAADTYLSMYEANVPVSAQLQDVPTLVAAYVDEAALISDLLAQVTTLYSASQLSASTSRDAASRLSLMTETQRADQLRRLEEIQNSANLTSILGLVATLLVGVALTALFTRNLSRDVGELLQVARELEKGNLWVRAPVVGDDEFSQLGASFNTMARQLEELVGNLEKRVAERTRDLTITADIGHAVVARRDPRELMDDIVELIRQRFGYYHAQVFLVDDEGQNANLVSSTGTAGRELLARRHFLPVGSESVIGQVTALGEPIVALDTGASSVIHRPNPLLPDTRSEMALPMRVGRRVIGALDVQSVAPNAFDPDVVAVFQIMADQLAIALENARLQHHLEALERNVKALERRIVLDAWESYRQARSPEAPLGFALEGDSIRPHRADSPSPLKDAMETGRVVLSGGGVGEEISLAIPIRVRGEVIGAFGFGGESLGDLVAEDLTLIEAIVDRVGMTLENLRLVEVTARRAEHEQILNEITAKIVGATDVNQILQTTVRELGRVLKVPQTSVQLRPEGVDKQP